MSVIDTATNTVTGTPIPVGDRPGIVAISPDGTRAYVTNAASNTVSVISITKPNPQPPTFGSSGSSGSS
ncbi:hypothetical protein [Aldersonia sp. NBC_00410]|uniref:YncE family protein n=1 Tax=Aldersonia sp. NBC_00410 TaxID=2975954 RepID=UPI002B1CEA9F|nr:hypothetical protein [Aldersonia sp. NBC_00410]